MECVFIAFGCSNWGKCNSFNDNLTIIITYKIIEKCTSTVGFAKSLVSLFAVA